MNYDSPSEIRAELERRGLALKKRWGQNFLVNRGARESLVRLLDPREGDRVWEIGPGLGSMTELVLAGRASCIVFEIDRGMCRFLDEAFGGRSGFSLVAGDFVKTWRAALAGSGAPDLLLGNLPYRSASLMIADIVEGGLRPRRSVLTVQREAAERMSSSPGVKAYSSFSVLCQAVFTVRNRGDLKPGSFYPVPEVVSSIVELLPREDAPAGAELLALDFLARCLFTSRRKTIRNNLAAPRLPAGLAPDDALSAVQKEGADLGMRAEELSPEFFIRAARRLAAENPGSFSTREPSDP